MGWTASVRRTMTASCAREESPPSRRSCGNSPSRGSCKPSTSRISCAVAMGTVRRGERWTPWTGLTSTRQFGQDNVVVEADIKGFFDNIDHGWGMRMLAERIEDGAFLRLIRKGLKAGVLETDGQVLHPATGTPQGGIRSPSLAARWCDYGRPGQ